MKIKGWMTRDIGGAVDLWFGERKPYKLCGTWFADSNHYVRIGVSDINEELNEPVAVEIEIPLEVFYEYKILQLIK